MYVGMHIHPLYINRVLLQGRQNCSGFRIL